MIKCPSNALSKVDRIKAIYDEFDKWINSKELQALICITGGEMPIFSSFQEKFEWLFDYSRRWDFRAKQGNGGERWEINDTDVYERKADEIKDIAIRMGLEGGIEVTTNPDYILALGGARMSNYTRCELAKRIYDEKRGVAKYIIALAGLRKLNEVEMPFVEKYAPGSSTEFEAISRALEVIFELDKTNVIDNIHEDLNDNLSWIKRKYINNEKTEFYSLAAPSTDGSRRANSFDTFEFFLSNFDVKKEEYILAVTSSIYVPFQTIKFLQLAIERNINIEFTGGAAGAFNKASNYCQEIKAAFDAMNSFMTLYPLEP